jgi:multiple sugar transport system ATP-binding protein
MQGGYIEQIGTPLELYDRPRNVFVAGFIGSPSMNFFEGQVVKSGRSLAAQIGDAVVSLPKGAGVAEGQEVIIGIRPEALQIADKGISGTISVIEPTGSETHVMLRHSTGQDFTLISRERRDFKVGQTITMTAYPDHLHIFDKSTKERV